MIVQCENCQAKFRLDDSKVPEQGRKVRCSKCKHVFLVRKEPESSAGPVPEAKEQTWEDTAWESAATVQDAAVPAEPEPAFEPKVRIDFPAEEAPALQEQAEQPPPTRPSPAKRGVVGPLLVGAGVVAALAIVVVVLARLGFLPFLFPETQEPATAQLIIDQAQLQGKWEKNAQVPRIFVISGTVQNQSKKPKAFVKVRGLLLDKGGRTVKEVWAYCGNSIPLEDLRTKAPNEIQNIMRNREGQQGANKLVAAGARIPFTLVFFEVPEGVESFGAEVVEAQIAGT